MPALAAAVRWTAPDGADAASPASRYARHAPERTLLYALVQAHYPEFLERQAAHDRPVPDYVRAEFDEYLRCGVLEHGFLRVVCEQCHAERLVAFSCKKRGLCPSCGARRMAESARHLVEEVFGERPVRQWVLSFPYPLRFLFASQPEALGPVLGLVQRAIAGWLADQAGVERRAARSGAVTLIQRFGSALNLNVHLHMLWLDGVYEERTASNGDRIKPRLHRARAPTSAQLTGLADTIARRVLRHLAKRGWLEGEAESVFLSERAERDDGLDAVRMSSITYRIATGQRAGQKVATLHTLPGDAGSLDGDAGRVGGFSLHAGVAAPVQAAVAGEEPDLDVAGSDAQRDLPQDLVEHAVGRHRDQLAGLRAGQVVAEADRDAGLGLEAAQPEIDRRRQAELVERSWSPRSRVRCISSPTSSWASAIVAAASPVAWFVTPSRLTETLVRSSETSRRRRSARVRRSRSWVSISWRETCSRCSQASTRADSRRSTEPARSSRTSPR